MGDFIPTRGSKNIKNKDDFFVNTSYKAAKQNVNSSSVKTEKKNDILIKKIEKPKIAEDSDDEGDDNPMDEKKKQELEMKKFRYDIIKFGMSGMEKHKAQRAKVALAISLGAQPPKKRKIPYKTLIQKRKLQKVQEAKKNKFVSGFNSNQLTKNKKQHKKGKKSDGILGVYGTVKKDKGSKKKHKE